MIGDRHSHLLRVPPRPPIEPLSHHELSANSRSSGAPKLSRTRELGTA